MSAAAALPIIAPTDAQIDYLATLASERGIVPAPVVYSMRHASECIGAILRREYEPCDYDAFANGESAYDPEPCDDYADVPF